MSKQKRRTAPKPEAPKTTTTECVATAGTPQPCSHAATEEIAYDEPSTGRYVAADRCWQCGAVKMRGIGTKWVPPGEKMGN